MLHIENLSRRYHNAHALENVSLRVEDGHIAALIGPSGSGKSTLLRLLCRLEKPDSGRVTLHDAPLESLPVHEIGMVFQGFHLFPHLTVLQNLTCVAKKATAEVVERAEGLLKQFGLHHKAGVRPTQLSGGQKQRVAIARCLMLDPRLLLFDEPTSALDPELVHEVGQLLGSLGRPDRVIVMATHELRLARQISNQVVLLVDGRPVEATPTVQFFEEPQSERGRQFIARHR